MGDENVYNRMDLDLLHRINILRERVGQPLIITSSYRDEAYNNEIGGSKRSMHLQGRAVDFACTNSDFRARIVKHALDLGLTVGVAKTFIHVDNRDEQILFTY